VACRNNVEAATIWNWQRRLISQAIPQQLLQYIKAKMAILTAEPAQNGLPVERDVRANIGATQSIRQSSRKKWWKTRRKRALASAGDAAWQPYRCGGALIFTTMNSSYSKTMLEYNWRILLNWLHSWNQNSRIKYSRRRRDSTISKKGLFKHRCLSSFNYYC
jgi:16S rRNA G1207 methylase RsmC